MQVKATVSQSQLTAKPTALLSHSWEVKFDVKKSKSMKHRCHFEKNPIKCDNNKKCGNTERSYRRKERLNGK